MESHFKVRRKYDQSFKLTLLKDYYESGKSKSFICRKYGIDMSNFLRWERHYESELISLPEDLSDSLSELMRSRKRHHESLCSSAKSKEEELQDEIKRLRKALAYSELRNEALNEVLKAGKETYGIDLLKKVGAKQ